MKNFTLNSVVIILVFLLILFCEVLLVHSVLGASFKEWFMPRVVGLSFVATFLSGIPLGIVMFISVVRTPQYSDRHDPVELRPGLAGAMVFFGAYLLYLITVFIFDISDQGKLKGAHLIISASLAVSWWFFWITLFGNLGFCFSKKRNEPPSFD